MLNLEPLTKPKVKPILKNGWRLRALFRIENFLREHGEHSRARRMGICGNTIRVKVHKEDKHNMLFQPQLRCKDRICPVCNSYRAGIMSRKVEKLGEKMKNPHMLTITASAENRDNLEKAFEAYRIANRKFKRNKTWFKKYVDGGVEHIEVTRKKEDKDKKDKKKNNKSGWHIHSHMLVDLKVDRPVTNIRYKGGVIEVDIIKKELEAALKQCGLGVISDIRPVTEGYGREISKYALKIAVDTPDDDLLEIVRHLTGKRMVSKFGSCYGKKNDDLEELKPEEMEMYENYGTIEEVTRRCFASGIDLDLFIYVKESIRIGLFNLHFDTS